ncbi:PAS domain-containing sensor histidine kinase [Rickettsiella endosymbiont of Dermanyssus gallinae]|uniref:PAS domain-containing sensor histidine kinase n=1 Tax=Rickettsiella endosymbiont of Dermanyssus gallinae TaxID=2856608 RepID=UPI001C530B73|nr:PAS domain-containing sensor histidine kinase [Rickettsiella endosymbiont of Dermanyssus gallinae]
MLKEEKTYKKTMDLLSIGVYWKDKKNLYIDCNLYFCQLLGIGSSDIIIGKNDETLNNEIHYKDTSKTIDGQTTVLEKSIIHKKGIKKHLLIHEVQLEDNKDNEIKIMGVVTEITSLKKEILTLKKYKKEAQTYLENIMARMPGSVYWKNREGVYLGCNGYVAKIAGVSSIKEVIGKTDFDFSWKDEAPTILQAEREIMESEVPRELEISGRLSNGKKATFLVIKTPLYNVKKEVIGILATSLDITERKRLEENLVAEKEKAEAANQAKTEFLENMRHDIRTPLSGIVGCAHLIQRQSNNPKKVEEYATDLVDSSNALLEFLNKILESIQVATGEIPLLRKKFDLNKILEQVVHLNKPQADVKNLDLHFYYDKNIPPYLLGDPIRLQRIALELVTNALKYTDKGEIKVSARLIENKKREVIIELRVSDTGMGIPRDKHQEIYTRFTRLTPSYQGIYPGTGLGLSVVKQFIDDLGGEIQLDSQPNQGSTFTCYIPLQESLSPPTDKNETEETLSFAKGIHVLTKKTTVAPGLQEMPVTTGSRVLVVEDHPIAAKVAQGALLELNCQTDIAPDGKTALTLVEKNYYDLILMDIGLPDGDGCDVTRRIRLKQWQSNPSVPIIGLTAHTVEEKKKRCLENGMNAIYSKPLTPEKASEILSVFLSHSQASALKANRDESSNNNDLQSLPLLDKEKALKLLGSEEIFHELLGLLESGLIKEIVELKQYHQDKDWQGVAKLAHKWKGGASYCGASRLEQVCKEICKEIGAALKAKSPEKLEILYQALLQVVEETNEAARKIIASDK